MTRRKQPVEIDLDGVSSDYLPDFERVVDHVRGRYLTGRASADEVRRDLEKLRFRFPKPKPHPSTYDLDRELRWTFPMTLAWIVWRTPEKVVEYSPSYRSVARTWGDDFLFRHGIDDPFITRGEPAINQVKLPPEHILADLHSEAAADGTVYLSIDRALIELWRNLLSGNDESLIADGIPQYENRRVEIPHREFADLTLDYGAAHDAILRSDREGAGYIAPRLNPNAVKRCWRVAPPKKNSLSSAKEHFRVWLTEMIESSPHIPTMTNKQIWEAIEHLPGMGGLSKASFEKVKRDVIAKLGAAAWSAGGRRKSSRREPSNE